MTREILQWPARRLRQSAQSVDQITDGIRAIWDDMVEVMEAMPGVGLAAPQLGVMLRLAVVDASEGRGNAVRMANPELLQVSSETKSYPEASPCLPGMSANVKRPSKIAVRFLNENGMIDRRDFEGLWAISMQHQIDHLNGKMYFDRLSSTKRDMFMRKLRKSQKSD